MGLVLPMEAIVATLIGPGTAVFISMWPDERNPGGRSLVSVAGAASGMADLNRCGAANAPRHNLTVRVAIIVINSA